MTLVSVLTPIRMAGISSGQILRLKEVLLLGNSLENKSVRTWGRVVAHDITKSQVKIAADGVQMLIDTSLVEPMAFNIGSLYNFIGEMSCHGKVILRARIACCIDGMDMDLFDKALDVRRKYLQEEIFPEDQML